MVLGQQERTNMDEKFAKILRDYTNCIKMPACADCKAWKKIEESNTSWCEFLTEHNEEIYNKISEILGR